MPKQRGRPQTEYASSQQNMDNLMINMFSDDGDK